MEAVEPGSLKRSAAHLNGGSVSLALDTRSRYDAKSVDVRAE